MTKGVATPGVDGLEEIDRDDDVDITGADATRFHGVAARCNYLAFDRPDMNFSTKEICREMSKPTTGSLRRLRRLGQYLAGKPRLVWHFDMQDPTTTLDVFTDSDWAGCRKSRKSTSGGTVMLGGHCLKTWSRTQAIVAKSSAEAELYGVVKGAAEGMGMATLIGDLGDKVGIQMHLDAAAAKGIIERRGLSKIRHLDVNILWLQEVCARKVVPLKKVPGVDNPADLTTKHLQSALIEKNVKKMNMSFETGRAEKAAKLHTINYKVANGNRVEDNFERVMNSVDRLSGGEAWKNIRKAGNDLRGGGRWKTRGKKGVWHRWHVTPRISLFTPYRVAKGPGKGTALSSSRFTCGVTASGESFEFFDDWTTLANRHRVLTESWVGYTIFKERSVSNLEVQLDRPSKHCTTSTKCWADCMSDDEK